MAPSHLQKWGESSPNSTGCHLIIERHVGADVSNILIIKWEDNNMEQNVLNGKKKKSLFCNWENMEKGEHL